MERHSGVVLGTASYMSPEQVRGERVDARSDLFAFGCILYEMLAGRQAFARSSRIETMHAVCNEEPEPIARVEAQTPSLVEQIVSRCLQKAPDKRFQSTMDLQFALETAV